MRVSTAALATRTASLQQRVFSASALAALAKGGSVRVSMIDTDRGEMVVWILPDSARSNDRNREIRCGATIGVPQKRGFSASAIAAWAKGGSVRKADAGVECSKRPLPAQSAFTALPRKQSSQHYPKALT